jgi:hypothetical protein
MKNVFKFLSLGVLVMAFYAISATSIFAQGTQDECTAIYERFKLERVKTTEAELNTAVATGKEYLQKCSAIDPPQDEVKTYVTNQIPKLQQKAIDAGIKVKEDAFNAALKAKNFDGIVASAKDLIGINRPYSLDLMLDIATVGYDNSIANPPVDKYNSDALMYAKLALQKMSEGQSSGNSDLYGFYFNYKNTACSDGKLNATGWMNYIIGFITYGRQKQVKEGVPFIYKSTQNGCFTKTFSEPYRLIGVSYLDETIKLNNEYIALTKANGDKENDESLAKLAMVKAYAERALEAYARAYKFAVANPKSSPTYKEALLSKVKQMYDVRYDDTSKVDAYVAEVSNKPFTDPSTPVTPVVLPPPTTTTGTSVTPKSATLTSSSSSDAMEPANRPTSTTAATTAGSTTTAKTAATTTTKKPAAKKPVAKKKGTR